MNLGDAPAAIVDVVSIFAALDIPYCIGGSVASSTLGRFRATNDVDIVVDLKPQHTESLIATLQGKFYVDDEYIRESVARNRGFNLIHLGTMIKVDLFPLKPRAYDHTAFSRRQPRKLATNPPLEADLFAPEDVVLSKLEWYEMGGRSSERQWGDIVGVLQDQSDLDLEYMRYWADELRVLGLLEEALEEAESTG